MKSTTDRRTTRPRNHFAAARRWPLALLCGLLLACSSLAQERRPEPLPTPDEQSAEAQAAEKAPDPNEAMPPVTTAYGAGSRAGGGGSQTVNGDIIFSSPGQFLYPRSIRLSDNFGVLRLYGAQELTTSPAGAAVQLFGNNAETFNGQLYLDSGAHDGAALIFRTAGTNSALTERMRILSDGRIGVGTTQPSFSTMGVVSQPNTQVAFSAESDNRIGIGVYGVTRNERSFSIVGHAQGDRSDGVFGFTTGVNGIGVRGEATGSGVAVYGSASLGATMAGQFVGNVQITGNLSKGSGTFKIDHPLDPENKYLSHSFVESPDMMNIYNGNVTLDRHGRATVTLPAYFEALNREFRYQLTAVGAPANLYVAAEIEGNQFRIAGGRPGMKVSWQVTGVRQDAYAEAHRVRVEEDKPAEERGTYLHPAEFGQPAEKGLSYARQRAEAASAAAGASGRPTVRQRRASRTER